MDSSTSARCRGILSRPWVLLFFFPKGPRTQIVETLTPKYPNRDYFKTKVSTISVHEPFRVWEFKAYRIGAGC